MERREHDDLAERGLRYTREHFEEILSQTETYVRQNPTQSLAYAVLAGFVLNRLGIGRILRGIVRLALFALKPDEVIRSDAGRRIAGSSSRCPSGSDLDAKN